MRIYYDGRYKIKDSSGRETIFNKLEDIPDKNKITELEIEDGVLKIPGNAFVNCRALYVVTMSDSVEEIGPSAFNRCISLEIIKMSNNITEIYDFAFRDCNSLKYIDLPNIKKIGASAFAYCTSLKEITIPDSVKTIYDNAFVNCTSLKNVVLSKNVSEIRDGVFAKCSSLESINISDNINKISWSAFVGCNLLDYKTQSKILNLSLKDIKNNQVDGFLLLNDIEQTDSEKMQELMAIDPRFYKYASEMDQEVFLDAVLYGINKVYEKEDSAIIETDLCNILIKGTQIYLYPAEDDNKLINISSDQNHKKMIKAIENYNKNVEEER